MTSFKDRKRAKKKSQRESASQTIYLSPKVENESQCMSDIPIPLASRMLYANLPKINQRREPCSDPRLRHTAMTSLNIIENYSDR